MTGLVFKFNLLSFQILLKTCKFFYYLVINFLGAFITVWFPLSVRNPSGISLSKPLMTQLVLSLLHSHSFLWMQKYAGNRGERRSLCDLRVVMARHFLSAFILSTVAPKLKFLVFAAVADYSNSPKHFSEYIEFSSLPAFLVALSYNHGPQSFPGGVWLAQPI